ncbi:MAG: SMI1/KNR4 family protein, partial [Muribaculaceae bacterium]|nr:SMI1/KNR4 family protein [Muribaculaceae bacterium]
GVLKVESTGATLIGYAPHIAPRAWLNCIYTKLTDEEIVEIENSIGRKMPNAYIDFLQNFSNGLNVLITEIGLYGKCPNLINRTGGYETIVPFNLIISNRYRGIKNVPEGALIIGGYGWDASKLYMMNDGTVYYCARYDATPLKKWDSLTEMLLEEIPRLYSLYDEDGVKLDPKQSSLPI